MAQVDKDYYKEVLKDDEKRPYGEYIVCGYGIEYDATVNEYKGFLNIYDGPDITIKSASSLEEVEVFFSTHLSVWLGTKD